MHGNVWEWCWDGYGEGYYKESREDDPRGPDGAANRVLRGGSWHFGPRGSAVGGPRRARAGGPAQPPGLPRGPSSVWPLSSGGQGASGAGLRRTGGRHGGAQPAGAGSEPGGAGPGVEDLRLCAVPHCDRGRDGISSHEVNSATRLRILPHITGVQTMNRNSEARLHADRALGRHRDHRRPDRAAPARRPVGARGGTASAVRQQPEADRPGPAQLPDLHRRVPSGRDQGPGLLRERLHNLGGLERPRPDAPVPGTGGDLQLVQLRPHGVRLHVHARRQHQPDGGVHADQRLHLPVEPGLELARSRASSRSATSRRPTTRGAWGRPATT